MYMYDIVADNERVKTEVAFPLSFGKQKRKIQYKYYQSLLKI